MRRFFISTFIASFTFLLLGVSVAWAQTPRAFYDWSTTLERPTKILGASDPDKPLVTPFTGYVFGGNLTPANPFYFFKTIQENVNLTFTFDPTKKEELRITIAGQKALEMEQLASSQNTRAIEAAAREYENRMKDAVSGLEQLKSQNKDVSTLVKKMEEASAAHTILIQEASVQNPTLTQVDKAVDASANGADTAADIAGRPAVPPDLTERLEALKSQGLLTEEETAKIVASKTRSEARSEMGKYVQEGIIPESDFLRMDEGLKALHPEAFYKLHEVKRFQELRELESQKPDPATLVKIQDTLKTYQPGDTIPAGLRRYWVAVIRLEELQNTLRPDLIDPELLKKNQEDYKKFTEIVERAKPRPEDIATVQTFMDRNNATVSDLPPEYQRMYNLAKTYGAQCGNGLHWIQASTASGGYCAKEGSSNATGFDAIKNRSCNGPVVSAKNSGGACSAFTTDCVPPGWLVVNTCVETPGQIESVGKEIRKTFTCPSNSHFVPIPYLPDGGYCIPNYTTIGSSSTQEITCQGGTHRSFPGGPCISDGGTGIEASTVRFLSPLSLTPGGPNYPTSGRCGAGSHFVPEPINPNGGYCAPDSYTPSFGISQITPVPGNGLPKADMGNCRTPAECYDYCKSHPTEGDCKYVNPNMPRPDDSKYTGPRPSGSPVVCQLYCANGYVDGQCACKDSKDNPSQCKAPANGCPSGWYWNAPACSCNPSEGTKVDPKSCQQPSGGCPSGWNWVASACSCNRINSGGQPGGPGAPFPGKSSSGGGEYGGGYDGSGKYVGGSYGGYDSAGNYVGTGSSGGSGSNPQPNYTPPSGYGTCPSGQMWNGSGCMSNSSPESKPPTYTPPSSYQTSPPSSYSTQPPSGYSTQPPSSYTPPSSYSPSSYESQQQQPPPPPSSYAPPPPPSSYEPPPPPSSYSPSSYDSGSSGGACPGSPGCP